jgi:hypothetical protein
MESHLFLLLATSLLAVSILAQDNHFQHPGSGSDEGFGQIHIDISCSPAVAADFDRVLALLHNFWYVRALKRFNQVLKNDPGCAVAYWGAVMTYNHPFWDPPSASAGSCCAVCVSRGVIEWGLLDFVRTGDAFTPTSW